MKLTGFSKACVMKIEEIINSNHSGMNYIIETQTEIRLGFNEIIVYKMYVAHLAKIQPATWPAGLLKT